MDLILERDGVCYPIEIKSVSNPSRRDTTGLRAFRDSHPRLRIARGLVVAPCEKLLPLSENDHSMPWDACCRRSR